MNTIQGELLNLELILELIEDILSLDLCHFLLRVLIDEVVNVHETSTNSHLDRVTLLNLEVHTLLAELIYAFRLSKEKDLHPFLFRIVGDIVLKNSVNLVILVSDICLLGTYEILNFCHEVSNLLLSINQLTR